MSQVDIEVRKKKPISKVLISQPKPTNLEKSPYFRLANKYNLQLDFRQFIQVEPVSYKEFRKEKIDILSHTAVIFTSRNAVDNFFRICAESKVEVPASMKYFCITEQTANYLQKYIVVRKRKIFIGERTAKDLIELLAKHKDEKYLFPCSNIRKEDIPGFLKEQEIEYTEVVLYKTVASDLSDLEKVDYDLVAFFSPSGIHSLMNNFPNFKQGEVRIAAFGPTTAKAVKEAGLYLDIEAPKPNVPSITGAIELYIKEALL